MFDNQLEMALSTTQVQYARARGAGDPPVRVQRRSAGQGRRVCHPGRGAAVFIRAIDGSYSGVMGLPLYETSQLLGKFGRAPLLTHAGR